MVELRKVGKEEYFFCEECGFAYKENKWAVKCEDYCNKNPPLVASTGGFLKPRKPSSSR